jgi:hypothetical protein
MATEGRIDFFTQNPLFATDRKLERTGIGIDNTKKDWNIYTRQTQTGDHKREWNVYGATIIIQLTLSAQAASASRSQAALTFMLSQTRKQEVCN